MTIGEQMYRLCKSHPEWAVTFSWVAIPGPAIRIRIADKTQQRELVQLVDAVDFESGALDMVGLCLDQMEEQLSRAWRPNDPS